MELQPNQGKNLLIDVDGHKFARYPIKTKLITPQDKDIAVIIEQFARAHVQPGDIVFVSEKAVAITQGRSYPINEIKASSLAQLLSRFVMKTPVGIGLGSPQTMQLAIEEVGMARILLAAFVGAIGKLFGVRGWFYMIAGDKARSIDGAVPYALPPYNTYVSKGPAHPDAVAGKIAEKLGVPVAIVDANDLGVNVLGASQGVDRKFVTKAIKDNPLGQSDEQTPVGIIRTVVNAVLPMIVRQAVLKDKKDIVELTNLLHLEIPGFIWNDTAFIDQQIKKGEYFLVEYKGMVVGMMSLRVKTRKMNIETLAVKKEFQSQGFGTQLLSFAKKAAKEKGFNILHAYSFPEYNMSHFYEKNGFTMLTNMGNYQGHPYHCFEIKLP